MTGKDASNGEGRDPDGVSPDRRLHASITRAELLRRSAGLIGAASFAGIVAACGGSSNGGSSGTGTSISASTAAGTTGASGATTAAAAGRTTGGVMKLGMQTVPPGFDPNKWWNGSAYQGIVNVFDRLYDIDLYSGKTVPSLAADFPEVPADGKTYTFTLRPNVTFHDGSPLTSEDVKYTFERLVSPDLGSEIASVYNVVPIVGMADFLAGKAKELSGITTPDPNTVVFQLDGPDTAFVPSLTYYAASIVPKAVVEKVGHEGFNWAPVGTGPFTMTKIDKQKGVTLEKNSNYWQDGLPYVDGIDWEFNVDPELSVLRILKGDQDLMYEPVPAGAIEQIRGNPDTKDLLVLTTQDEPYWVSLSQKVPELKDVRVRKAIAKAIDKQKLQRVLKGIGAPATGGLFPPPSPYYQEGLGYTLDPEGAKQLLADAGLGSGFTVKAWSPNFTPWTDMAQSAQQDLKAVGITLDYTAMSYDQFVAFTTPAPAGLVFFNWGLAYPHGSYIVDAAFTQAAIEAGCCNYAYYKNPEVDKLALQARASTSESESVDLYKQIDKIVTRDDVVWVPLIYAERADVHSKRLEGYAATTTGTDEPQVTYEFSVSA